MIRNFILSSSEKSGINLCSFSESSDFEYAVTVLLLSENPSKLSIFPRRLDDNTPMIGMHLHFHFGQPLTLHQCASVLVRTSQQPSAQTGKTTRNNERSTAE